VIASLDLELTPRRKFLLAAFAAATILLIPAGLWIAGIPAFVLCAWLVATDPEPKLRRRLAILLGCVLILAACDINPGLSNENFLKVGIPFTLVIVLPSLIQHFGDRGIIRYRFWPVHWRKHDVIYTILSIPLAYAVLKGYEWGNRTFFDDELFRHWTLGAEADPAEIRRRNLIPKEAYPYARAMEILDHAVELDSGDFAGLRRIETELSAAGLEAICDRVAHRGPSCGILGVKGIDSSAP
jgi:hypothetical protein